MSPQPDTLPPVDQEQARVRAERCFAIARASSVPTKRDAAVARGLTIAEAARLDLDQFDIPGRWRPGQPREALA